MTGYFLNTFKVFFSYVHYYSPQSRGGELTAVRGEGGWGWGGSLHQHGQSLNFSVLAKNSKAGRQYASSSFTELCKPAVSAACFKLSLVS